MAPILATATGVHVVDYRGELHTLWRALSDTKHRNELREILETRSSDVFGEEQVSPLTVLRRNYAESYPLTVT